MPKTKQEGRSGGEDTPRVRWETGYYASVWWGAPADRGAMNHRKVQSRLSGAANGEPPPRGRVF